MISPRVVFLEPLPLVREAVSESLRQDHGLSVVATTHDVSSTLLQATRTRAEVVIVSSRLDGSLSVLCDELHRLAEPPRLLVADSHPDDEALLRAIEAGADGYVSGAHGLAGLVDAVRALARGESVVPPAMLSSLLRGLIQRQREAVEVSERLLRLTAREREVLSLLVDGLDQQEIAAALVISPETARTHLQRAIRKLGAHSKAEAIALVARTGISDHLERLVERSTR